MVFGNHYYDDYYSLVIDRFVQCDLILSVKKQYKSIVQRMKLTKREHNGLPDSKLSPSLAKHEKMRVMLFTAPAKTLSDQTEKTSSKVEQFSHG